MSEFPLEPSATAIARTLGFRTVEAEPGYAVVEAEADPDRHGNQQGTVHGGFLVELIDAAMGTAHERVVGPHESFATLEIKVNFVRPVWKSRLRAEVRRVHPGRTISYYDGRIVTKEGKDVAYATSTVMTLTGRQAQGRIPAQPTTRRDDAPASAVHIMPIERAQDAAMARIIREVMSEFGAEGPGTSREDLEVDGLTAAYAEPGAAFHVVTKAGEVVGGGGLAPLRGADPDTCELRKMYLVPHARGHGIGAMLLDHLLAAARALGYRRCYLESLASMTRAIRLYESRGFQRSTAPLGATGHHACDVWMVLEFRRAG